ncbi:MAG TPA: S-methyl-5-thioribose-1-phosphate isomerase [Gaiellales bacterium]|nr:S-methyl-5-thioribose-1-phosphate isomerase [Gaiellales bacterium]
MTIQPQQIARLENGELVLLDQRLLPAERVEQRYARWQDIADAIRTMVVRGAPAIGVAAAYGVAVAARSGRAELDAACPGLVAARPTAVNLPWAVGRMREVADAAPDGELIATLDAAAVALHAEEVERCHLIGDHGAALIPDGGAVLTHCNAGALATGGYGTALGVIRSAHSRDPSISVWVDETRPLLQGARLTAWELVEDGIPATLVTDSMAGWLMAQGRVQAVVTGADRVARNGDAANKIGTYALSVLAGAHGVPFYIAAPSSTIDATLASGAEIPIEHRDPSEVRGGQAEQGIDVYNPAFDVTPAENITAIVTEHGIHRPPYDLG